MGLTWPVETSHAMRVVRTRVFPLPAPARISAGSGGKVTACCCGGLRPARSGDPEADVDRDCGSDEVEKLEREFEDIWAF